MQKAEFDKFAEEYYALHQQNVRSFGETPDFFAEYKIRDIYNFFKSQEKSPRHIIDFGAGIGNSVPYFHRFFPDASLVCLDVSEKSLQIGRSRFATFAKFQSFDGKCIPYPENTFDLIFAACVFHHIPKSDHPKLFREWLRVVKPGGIAIVFEHNPYNPLTIKAVNTCPFDENAELIRGKQLINELQNAGFDGADLRYRLFFPGILSFLRPLERWLYNCPLGAQYFVHATKP